MLSVLKRTVSMRLLCWAPKHLFKLMDKKIVTILDSTLLLIWAYEIYSETCLKRPIKKKVLNTGGS